MATLISANVGTFSLLPPEALLLFVDAVVSHKRPDLRGLSALIVYQQVNDLVSLELRHPSLIAAPIVRVSGR